MQKRPSTTYQSIVLPSKYPLQVTLTDTSYIHCRAEDAANLHFHDCLEFAVCIAGNGTLTTVSETIPFHAKDTLLLCPYTPHRIETSHDCRIDYIHVNLLQIQDPNIFPDLRRYAEMLLSPNALPCILASDAYPKINEQLIFCLEEAREKKPYYEMSIRGYFMCVVSMLRQLSHAVEGGFLHQTGCPLSPALVYLNLHYTQEIMISELARMCHLSDTHFRRLFKEYFQLSPLDYLNRIRIRESCTLLSGLTIRISQAAEQSGFRTLSSYNRKFLDVCGMSPTEWVKHVMPVTEKIPRIMTDAPDAKQNHNDRSYIRSECDTELQ